MLGHTAIAEAPISALAEEAGGVFGEVAFAGAGTFAADGQVVARVGVSFAGAGAFAADPKLVARNAWAAAGAGGFLANGQLRTRGAVSFRGIGSFDARAVKVALGAVGFAGVGRFLNTPYVNALVDSLAQIDSGIATIPYGLSTTIRPGALTFDYLWAATLGPETIGVADTGILDWAWYVRDDEEGNVWYARSNDNYDGWQAEQILFSYTGEAITELDCAFEQNGRIVVSASRPTGSGGASEIWLYWYNPFSAAFVFERFDDGRTPRVVLDNPNDTTIADVHVAYIKDGTGLLTRRQSEQYAIANPTIFTQWDGWYIEEFARNRGNRLTVIMSRKRGDRYSLDRIESTLYPFYPQDGVTLGASVLDSSELASTQILVELDVESLELLASVLNTSTLQLAIITTADQDEDRMELNPTVLATSTLAIAVITTADQDEDRMELNPTILNTSTLAIAIITNEIWPADATLGLSATVLNTSTLEVP